MIWIEWTEQACSCSSSWLSESIIELYLYLSRSCTTTTSCSCRQCYVALTFFPAVLPIFQSAMLRLSSGSISCILSHALKYSSCKNNLVSNCKMQTGFLSFPHWAPPKSVTWDIWSGSHACDWFWLVHGMFDTAVTTFYFSIIQYY